MSQSQSPSLQLNNVARVLIPVAQLDDSARIREDYSHVAELARSIKEAGEMLGKPYHLIQPIVCTLDFKVVDGGSRLRACRDVLKLDKVDVVFMETLREDQLRVLEMEANLRRKDFSWKEKVLGVVRVHEFRAREAVLQSERWTQLQTSELLGVAHGYISQFILLADYIRRGDKEILGAEGIREALKVLLDRKEREANKALAKSTVVGSGLSMLDDNLGPANRSDNLRKGPALVEPSDDDFFSSPDGPRPITAPSVDEDPVLGAQSTGRPTDTAVTIPLSSFLLHGDCIAKLADFPAESVDHCITDIPYGIDMSNLDQDGAGIGGIDTVAAEHTVDGNLKLMEQMFPAIYRVLKPSSFFVFFYDLDHHEKLQRWAADAGFRVQRWPLVWHKTHQCINQAAQYNFTKNFEVAMVCRKGNATLVTPSGTAVWQGGNEDTKAQLGHPFVKPYKLWSWVMGHVALRGQTILDPFAGVGSSTIAAIQDGYKPIAIELNEDHYNRQVVNISNLYRTLVPGCKFS